MLILKLRPTEPHYFMLCQIKNVSWMDLSCLHLHCLLFTHSRVCAFIFSLLLMGRSWSASGNLIGAAPERVEPCRGLCVEVLVQFLLICVFCRIPCQVTSAATESPGHTLKSWTLLTTASETAKGITGDSFLLPAEVPNPVP